MRAPQYFLLILLSVSIVLYGCSNGSDPIAPEPDGGSDGLAASLSPELNDDGRSLLMAFEAVADFDKQEITLAPLRTSAIHFDIRPLLTNPWFCPSKNCLKIQFIEFDPQSGYFKIRATLVNPTTIVAHDVRGIVYDNAGNNHEILNPDDYTNLWAPVGYDSVYPFRSFAKNDPERAIHALASHSEIYEFQFDPLPPKWNFFYAIDCSWPSNCEEPYEISNQEQIGEMYSTHACSKFSLDVLHHGGPAHVSEVVLDTTEMLGYETDMTYNLDEDNWEALILEDELNLSAGMYDVLITAYSPGVDIQLYDYFEIDVLPGDVSQKVSGTIFDQSTSEGIPLSMMTTSDGDSLYIEEADYCGFWTSDEIPDGSRVFSLTKPGYYSQHILSVVQTENMVIEEFLTSSMIGDPEMPIVEVNEPIIDIVGGFATISGHIYNLDCETDQVGVYVHQGQEYLMDVDDMDNSFNHTIILAYGVNEIVVRGTNATGTVLSDKITIEYYPDWNFRVTLTWDTATDMDLHMWEPGLSEHCYWIPLTSSHLVLDHDIIPGYGPENITPLSDDLPVGVYPIAVDYYSGYEAVTCVVTLRLNVGTPSETTIQFDHVLTVPDYMEYPVQNTTETWWRVADLVMDEYGVMTWQEADTSLILYE